jgi:hypothetical protein
MDYESSYTGILIIVLGLLIGLVRKRRKHQCIKDFEVERLSIYSSKYKEGMFDDTRNRLFNIAICSGFLVVLYSNSEP